MEAYRASCVFDGERFLDGGGTVLVDGGRITGFESFGFPVPTDVPVHDYRDASLLPGLIDTHTHLVCDSRDHAVGRVGGLSEEDITDIVDEALRRQLATGMTSVRDLGDRDFCVIDRRDRQSAGVLEPTIVGSGPQLTSVGGHCSRLRWGGCPGRRPSRRPSPNGPSAASSSRRVAPPRKLTSDIAVPARRCEVPRC
jgi:imidazolonepropionase-like amidohydrolase